MYFSRTMTNRQRLLQAFHQVQIGNHAKAAVGVGAAIRGQNDLEFIHESRGITRHSLSEKSSPAGCEIESVDTRSRFVAGTDEDVFSIGCPFQQTVAGLQSLDGSNLLPGRRIHSGARTVAEDDPAAIRRPDDAA